jgi:release factor glutamine methyltransferase
MASAFYKNMRFEVFDSVYEPKDDSSLLASCVDVGKGDTVLDLGCGSGIVGVVAAKQGATVTSSDINQKALENARLNARIHNVDIKTVHSDMFQNLGTFDYIFFNPPYLPHEDIDKEMLEEIGAVVKSWDGGVDGREFIDRFIKGFPEHLSPKGKAYLLNSSKNHIEKTKKMLEQYSAKIIAEEELFFETLYIFEICSACLR